MKTILILTATFGEGHNAAARNLAESLRALAPDTKVIISDIFSESHGRLVKLAQTGYLAAINRAPILWQGAFHLLDRTPVVEWHIGFYRAAVQRMEALLAEHRPPVVVSTYPGCNCLLDHVFRRRLARPFHTVTVVTDSLTINAIWHRSRSDFFCVANDDTATAMRNAGVPEKKIRVFGFPVPRAFSRLQSHRTVPPHDGKWRVLYVINSARHAAPEIARTLAQIDDVALTVTVGKDDALRDRVRKALGGRPVEIHGWTTDMPQLMAESHFVISKAGGATVQETLAAKTPLIITQIVPGQEEGNARLILQNDAGAMAFSASAIADTIRDATRNNGQLWHEWMQGVRSLSRPDAADRTAEFALSLTPSGWPA